MHGGRVEARQQGKVADDHQPLDVMGIGLLQGLTDGMGETAQAGVSGPEPGRQRAGMVKVILLRVAGHAGPVDAAHVLAPAQNLADKALDRRQRRPTLVVSVFRLPYHLCWVEHFDIQGEGQERMEQAPASGAHGVLVVTKVRQSLFDEGVELGQGFIAMERPGQALGAGGAKALDAGGDNRLPKPAVVVLNPGIGRYGGLTRPGLAVLGVEIPAAADWLAGRFHQYAMALPQAPIEMLH